MGSFPIAQVREPFSSVQFIAERLDLPHLLKLQHPEGDDEWSAMDVCDGTVCSCTSLNSSSLSCSNSNLMVLYLSQDGPRNVDFTPPKLDVSTPIVQLIIYSG